MREGPILDRVIFGDNQFFGINHMSEEKAQALAEKFYGLKPIMDVIDIAYECGQVRSDQTILLLLFF